MAPGRVGAGAGARDGGPREEDPLPAARRRADGSRRECPAGLAPVPLLSPLRSGGRRARRPLVSRGTWKLSETLRTHARTHAERRSKGSYVDFLAAARRPREGRRFTHLWYSRLVFVFPEAVSVKPAPRSRMGRRACIV